MNTLESLGEVAAQVDQLASGAHSVTVHAVKAGDRYSAMVVRGLAFALCDKIDGNAPGGEIATYAEHLAAVLVVLAASRRGADRVAAGQARVPCSGP